MRREALKIVEIPLMRISHEWKEEKILKKFAHQTGALLKRNSLKISDSIIFIATCESPANLVEY